MPHGLPQNSDSKHLVHKTVLGLKNVQGPDRRGIVFPARVAVQCLPMLTRPAHERKR